MRSKNSRFWSRVRRRGTRQPPYRGPKLSLSLDRRQDDPRRSCTPRTRVRARIGRTIRRRDNTRGHGQRLDPWGQRVARRRRRHRTERPASFGSDPKSDETATIPDRYVDDSLVWRHAKPPNRRRGAERDRQPSNTLAPWPGNIRAWPNNICDQSTSPRPVPSTRRNFGGPATAAFSRYGAVGSRSASRPSFIGL